MTVDTQIDKAIEPVYAFNPHGGVVLLHEGPLAAKLTGGGKERIYNGQGRVLFQLAPEPAIPWEVIANVADDTNAIESPAPSVLVVPEFSDLTFPDPFAIGPVPDISEVDGANSRFWGGLERTQIGNPEGLFELRYHLIGFPLEYGSQYVVYPNGQRCPGRISLATDEWMIDIDVWPDWLMIERHSLVQGKPPLSPVRMCRIRLKNGELFSARDVQIESLRLTLTLFLSFVSGALVGAALPVGFDARGEKQYVEWSSTVVDPIAVFKSWYPFQQPELLNVIFAQFLELAKEPRWHSTLVTLIRNYAAVLSSWKDPGFGVATAYVGFESLSYKVFVIEKNGLTKKQHKQNSIAVNLRMLLEWANIPTVVPRELASLRAEAENRDGDAPATLTWIRNRLVHGDAHDHLHYDSVAESWTLSLWYLELLLLRLMSYNGSYVSRIGSHHSPSDYPLVPWAAQAD